MLSTGTCVSLALTKIIGYKTYRRSEVNGIEEMTNRMAINKKTKARGPATTRGSECKRNTTNTADTFSSTIAAI